MFFGNHKMSPRYGTSSGCG